MGEKARHHLELVFCRRATGLGVGGLCEKCDGKCVICDSYVRPCSLVRTCAECDLLSRGKRCLICDCLSVSDAYYCKECVLMEKDRDGCPKVVNIQASRIDLFYERKCYGLRT